MKRLIVLGGGEIAQFETSRVDKYLKEISNKENPNLLFIPTASNDDKDYVRAINIIFGKRVRCSVSTLYLHDSKTTKEQAFDLVDKADIIYIGGGNSKLMLEMFRKIDLDKKLINAYNSGKICSGLSAGCISWFLKGHSDSNKHNNENSFEYIFIDGMNVFNLAVCPHFNVKEREISFEKMIKNIDEVGIGLQDNCAIEFKDNEFRIIRAQENAKAYKIFYNENGFNKIELTNEKEFLDISFLYDKSQKHSNSNTICY